MPKPSYATRLRNEIASVKSEIADLEKRLSELLVAERVMSSLGDEEDQEDGGIEREQTIPE